MDEFPLRDRTLTYEEFRALAADPALTRYGKIGFPDAYRSGHEPAILEDICGKLTNLSRKNQVVLDIGPGCSELPLLVMSAVGAAGGRLLLVDSDEMLAHLPDAAFVTKFTGPFPSGGCGTLFEQYRERIDVVLAYSLLHHVFADSNPVIFLDRALSLLAPGGQMLLGDIPNVSKRKRLFDSQAGVEYHRALTGRHDAPSFRFNVLEPGRIDDATIVGLLLRCRASGFDAYVVPQSSNLPMANRREDLLIVRP
jgi:hypothetical protein